MDIAETLENESEPKNEGTENMFLYPIMRKFI